MCRHRNEAKQMAQKLNTSALPDETKWFNPWVCEDNILAVVQ